MKFKVTTSGYFYNKEKMERLQGLGFRFTKRSESKNIPDLYHKEDSDVWIEFNTLGELMKFVRKWGDVILTENKIEIYDDHRE